MLRNTLIASALAFGLRQSARNPKLGEKANRSFRCGSALAL